MPSPGEITRLLGQLREGDRQAEARLAVIVYDELRRLARRYMRQERPNHTLQATALVHEAYIQMFQQKEPSWENRAHFFAIAANTMRRILVDHARARNAVKRGGGEPRESLEASPVALRERPFPIVELDDALTRFAAFAPRESKVVELRFFGGLSVEETARVLGVSQKTVKRDWARARAWLRGELRKDLDDSRAMDSNRPVV